MNRWSRAQSREREYWEKKWKKRKAQNIEGKLENYWLRHIYFAKKFITFKSHYKILDIGCGADGIINYVNIGERWGFDPLIDCYLSNFSMPIDINWKKGMAENLPFDNESFDIIFTTNALDHTADPQICLKEMNRCLKTNGHVYLTVNCYLKYVMILKKFKEKIGFGDICHPHSFTKKNVRDLLTSMEFEIIVERDGIGDLGRAIQTVEEPSSRKISGRSNNAIIFHIKSKEDCIVMAKRIINSFLSILSIIEGETNDTIFIARKIRQVA